MESIDKDVKNLNSQRADFSLSLRKKKLNTFILKKRLGVNDNNYTIKKEEIIIKDEFKDKNFSDITELLNFCSSILGNENANINDIKFAIYLLKKTTIKIDKGEVSRSNIIKDISKTFLKYLDNTIIVDELLSILISFSFYLTIESNMNLLTADYLKIYSNISSQYFNNTVIFYDLIVLLGNLANDNIIAQKIFYQTKLFKEIYGLAQNEKSPKEKRDVSLLFLANFTKGIQKNNYFINDIDLLKSLIDIMVINIKNEDHTIECLESLGNLSEIESISEYFITKKELFNFIFEYDNSKYYIQYNKILVNIASFNENINLYLIENYNVIPYIMKLINSSLNLIKGQGFFLLGNLIENKPCKINQILYDSGLFNKVFEALDCPYVEILDKVLYILNVIMSSLNNEGIFRLFQNNIHIKLINILKNDYKREIIDKAIDAIIEFLQKDSQDRIIKQSFIDNGLKEVFTNMILDRNDAEIYLKTEQILKSYF